MGTLYVVATPIGNLGDISKRALEVLSSCDYIACEDTRQTLKLVNYFDIHTSLVSYHKFNESSKSNHLIKLLLEGKNIALVSDAGTPCISDPGFVLVREARENNIPVFGIPGCSATVVALSISGLKTDDFTFIGFVPQENKKFREVMRKVEDSSFTTFIFYESPKRIVSFVEKLLEYFKGSTIFIGSDLTKLHERSFYGKVEDIYEQIKNDAKIEKGEYVLVLEKKLKDKIIEEEVISKEALLIDYMVKNNKSMKDAIKELSKLEKTSKNELYSASLNLKNIFDEVK